MAGYTDDNVIDITSCKFRESSGNFISYKEINVDHNGLLDLPLNHVRYVLLMFRRLEGEVMSVVTPYERVCPH
jgi:hypothetical protein